MDTLNTTVEDAFEVLQTFLQNRITSAQEAGAEAMRTGDYEQVREALASVETLTDLLKQVDRLEDAFGRFAPEPERANDVDRLRKGLKTPQEEYYVPILKALEELGGSAEINDVLDRVRGIMANALNEHDLAMLPSGNDYRWRNTAMWGRFEMVKQGLLRNDSPRGVWEISEEGRHWLRKRGR